MQSESQILLALYRDMMTGEWQWQIHDAAWQAAETDAELEAALLGMLAAVADFEGRRN